MENYIEIFFANKITVVLPPSNLFVGTAPVVSSRSTDIEQNSSGSLETRVDSVYSCERIYTSFEPEIFNIDAYTLKVLILVSTFTTGLLTH